MPTAPRLSVASAPDLLAAIPYLFGFHPTHCAVVVAVRSGNVHFALRHDVPHPDPGALAALVVERGADGAFVLGYGSEDEIGPAVSALAEALRGAGLPVLATLRVDAGRYWSLERHDPGCHPPEGRPFDIPSTTIAASATFHGLAPRRDRETLVAEFAPVTGPERAAMHQATVRAEHRIEALGRRARTSARLRRSVLRAGVSAIQAARRRHRSGERLTDDQVAWLSMLLVSPAVLTYAWEGLLDEDLSLWTDVVRRAQSDYVCAPACLLSFASWQRGLGVEARAALDRSWSVDPEHRMTKLLDQVLNRGVPPTALPPTAKPRGRAA